MSFQDELLRNIRTKDEAETAKQEEMYLRAAEQAQFIYTQLKDTLIHNVNEGNYSLIDGNKTVSCVVPFPDFCQHYLKIDDKSIFIPATPSYLERQLQELLQAPKKQRKAIVKKYQGKNLSGGGTPSEYHPCVRFDINTSLDTEFGCIIQKLKEYAQADDISIEICVLNKYSEDVYAIGVDIKEISTSRFYYLPAVKCSSDIPETYSNDDAAIIANETSNINIDNMDGHQFEQFCANLLAKNGFSYIDVTKGSGDQGIDIIAYKDGVKYGIQCKCYAADIGNKAVQEAFAGKTYYKCHIGVVLTNRYFTRSAKDLAEVNGIILWDRAKLFELVEKANLKVSEK